MTSGPTNDNEVMFNASQVTNTTHHFSHEAMATIFEIDIAGDDRSYASQAARAAFDMVDHLEQELSRFIENSDISRLNSLKPGDELQLGLDCFKCLEHAKRLYEQTYGAFDITIGALFDCWLDKDKKLLNPTREQVDAALVLTGMDKLLLDSEWYTARVLVEGLRFDLGGIGKGYAADKMAEILTEWSLPRALIQAGASTVLAMDGPDEKHGWPITLSNPLDRSEKLLRVEIVRRVVGGSGVAQGMHIIDPRPEIAKPVEGKVASWSFTRTGVEADVLSTAFMIMSHEEIEKYCRKYPETAAMTVQRKEKKSNDITIKKFGNCPA